MKKLFLDDVRNPSDCLFYMRARIGGMSNIYKDNNWFIVRDYDSFVCHITEEEMPDIISFDHDLAEEHYDPSMSDDEAYGMLYSKFKEKTGLECAKFLKQYCERNGIKIPTCVVHSMNPVGKQNIERELGITSI